MTDIFVPKNTNNYKNKIYKSYMITYFLKSENYLRP